MYVFKCELCILWSTEVIIVMYLMVWILKFTRWCDLHWSRLSSECLCSNLWNFSWPCSCASLILPVYNSWFLVPIIHSWLYPLPVFKVKHGKMINDGFNYPVASKLYRFTSISSVNLPLKLGLRHGGRNEDCCIIHASWLLQGKLINELTGV